MDADAAGEEKLEDHQFQVDLFPTQKECLEYLKGLLKDQVSVSVGGSMTLFETGIIDFLENNQDIHYLDRYHSDHPHEIYHAALSCDYFLTSTNAVTMTGELYNVDGNGKPRCGHDLWAGTRFGHRRLQQDRQGPAGGSGSCEDPCRSGELCPFK